jgi:hypothetical protein
VRRPVVLVPLAILAGGCGGGSTKPKPPPPVVAPPAKHRLHVVIRGQDHHPRVGKPWHYEVRVTGANGKAVGARIHLQFLFAGAPVGEVGKHLLRNGVWRETFGVPGNPSFPPAARGQPLVLEATVTAPGYPKAKAGWPLTPK